MNGHHSQRKGVVWLGGLLIVFGLLLPDILLPTPSVGATSASGTPVPLVYLPLVLNHYPRQPGDLFGRALSLDGVDDYASVPDSPTLDLGIGSNDDFTIETFFYVPDLTNSTTDTLIWKQGAYGLYILFNTSLPDRFIYRIWTDPSSYVFLYADVDLSVGWHHVAAVFDNEYTASEDLLALYVDGGVAVSSTAAEWTPGIPNSSSAVNIGAYVGVNPSVGWLEETRLSNIVRYSGASATVPATAFSNDANTQALWHFNEAVGSTVFTDVSGNGNTLTGLNGAQTGNP